MLKLIEYKAIIKYCGAFIFTSYVSQSYFPLEIESSYITVSACKQRAVYRLFQIILAYKQIVPFKKRLIQSAPVKP